MGLTQRLIDAEIDSLNIFNSNQINFYLLDFNQSKDLSF